MWNNIEHQVWNKLKRHQIDDQSTYLLAVSGGLDSMVLLSVMKKIKPQAQIIMMHFHHGPGSNLKYRNECAELLLKQKNHQVHLELEKSQKELFSEDEYRTERLAFFEKMKLKYNVNFFLTAHHLDDVLETRLIKMIRGTGLQGFKSFQEWNQKIFRPFFELNKTMLQHYAEQNDVLWIEDPTNLENMFLRNWIRNNWLPQLDQKMPGASINLARSLQNIIQEAVPEDDRYKIESARYVTRTESAVLIDKIWLFSFSTKDQLSVLIRVIRESFQCVFSTNQIKEAVRRLDKNQNEHIFHVASIKWVINDQSIMLTYKE